MRRWYRLFVSSLLCCVLLVPNAASAQDQLVQRLTLIGVDTARFPDVTFYLGASGSRGQPIRDLRPEEFVLTIAGEPVTSTLKLDHTQRSPAVVLVADMSFAMNDQSVPDQARVRAMVNQIKRMLDLLPPDSPVSLVTFHTQADVMVDWQKESSALYPELNKLVNQTLPAPVPDAPYALTEAIQRGLEQFKQDNPHSADRPRALFVYAAGAPKQSVDPSMVQLLLDDLAPNTPAITFIGLGSNVDGQFQHQPGNPDMLKQAVQSLPGAVFLPYFTNDKNRLAPLQTALDLRAKQIADLEHLYQVTWRADALPTGSNRVDITVHEQTVGTNIRPPVLPPQITVQAPARVLRDQVELSVTVAYTQRSIKEVQYLLANQPIGTATVGPDFALNLDVARLYAADGPLGFTPDPNEEYPLVAVAIGEDGEETKSTNTLQVWLQAPPPEPAPPPETQPAPEDPPQLLIILLAVLALALIIALIALVVILNRRAKPQAENPSPPIPFPPFPPLPWPNGDDTVLASRSTSLSSSITIIEGEPHKTYPLQQGRQVTVGRGSGHDIPLSNRRVSRNHARLMPLSGGVQLTDLGSSNGTFVGERRQRLAPNEPEMLCVGDTFWVGPDVKLVIDQ